MMPYKTILAMAGILLVSACVENPATVGSRGKPFQFPATDESIIVETDPSKTGDPDDGLAARLLEKSNVDVLLVSATDGNVPIGRALENARELWPDHLVIPAADNCNSELVRAYREQLRQQKLTVLALGSLRNIAMVLECHPDLAPRINELIVVAGRKPGEEFWLNPERKVMRPMRDLNYETDRGAMVTVMRTRVRITLIPFAAGNAVRILPHNLRGIPEDERQRVVDHATTLWVVGGGWTIPPFDLVAAAYLISPEAFSCENVRMEAGDELVLEKVDQSRNQLCLPSNPDRLRSIMLSVLNSE